MNKNVHVLTSDGELYHYGVKGMKWGVRRYQDKNGRLTDKGKERYRKVVSGMSKHAGLHPMYLAKDNPNADDEFLDIVKLCYKEDTLQEMIKDPSDPSKSISPVDESIRKTRFRQDFIDDPDSVFDKILATVNSDSEDRSLISNNCPKVAATGCLAMMGYDYNAGRSFVGTNVAKAYDYWFDGVKTQRYDNAADAHDSYFMQVPNGSFGTISIKRGEGSEGHVLNWMKNSQGAFGLYEFQPKGGEKFTGNSAYQCIDSYVQKRPWFDKNRTITISDMTNATPNFEHMAEDSVVRIADGAMRTRIYDSLLKEYIED